MRPISALQRALADAAAALSAPLSAAAERRARRRGGGWRRPRRLRRPAGAGRAAGLARARRRRRHLAGADRRRIDAGRRPGDLSGFRLLPDGDDALEARIALIRRAEKIDRRPVLPDRRRRAPGRQFLARAVRRGGARRARPRPGRRPVRRRRGRAVRRASPRQPERRGAPVQPAAGARRRLRAARRCSRLHEFARINHRMHNKLLIADDSFAITGGRNIADEYFDRSGRANFIDMDLLSAGPVVRRAVGGVRRVLELATRLPGRRACCARASATPPRAGRRRRAPGAAELPTAPTTRRRSSQARSPTSSPPAGSRCASPPRAWSPTAPRQGRRQRPRRAPTARSCTAHLDLLASARSSVLVAIALLRSRPPTASEALRAGDAPATSRVIGPDQLARDDRRAAGPLRLCPLSPRPAQLGVALHELMPTLEAPAPATTPASGTAPRSAGCTPSCVVVDERWLSIGSMNMDRRSARSNTESAIVIDDAGARRRGRRLPRARPRRRQLRAAPRRRAASASSGSAAKARASCAPSRGRAGGPASSRAWPRSSSPKRCSEAARRGPQRAAGSLRRMT